jgi:hypothetical protein
MIYEKLTKEYWMEKLKISDEEIPELIVIEGSWKIGKRVKERKSMFDAE